MATPSLALVPSGIKATKVYSVLPNNGDGDFTFARASTATRINKDGLIESVATNVPRLNYDLTNGVAAECPSLLLEPSSTNLVTYSESFDNSYWTKSALSAVSGFISPDGNANAFKLVEDTSSGVHRLLNSAISLSGDILISIFAKKGERNWFKLSNNNVIGAYFDLQSGSVGTVDSGVTANIENYGNGWYRCSILKNRATSGSERLVLDLSLDGSGTSYLGDGTSGIYIYGAQLEIKSYPTSYIPTSGSTQTRSAETCNGAGTASTFNSTEGVLYAEIAALSNDQTNRRITISDGTNTNRIVTGYNTTSNQIFYFVVVAGSTVASGNYTSSDITEFSKIAIKYKVNDFALWVDGTERHTEPSGAIFSADTLDSLQFEQGAGGSLYFYGNVKELRVYNEALTDAQLQTLTT